MQRKLARSIAIAALIVAAGAALISVDPLLLAAYRSVAPTSETVRLLAAWAEHILDPRVVLAGIILYLALTRVDRLGRFKVLTGTALTQALLISSLKRVFSRMRPADLADTVAFWGPVWRDEHNSFPGGHAAAAFALAAVFSAWHPRWRWPFYITAALITMTRIHLDRHFFGDCFIGAWLGYWIAQCFLLYVGGRPVDLRGHGDAPE